VHAGDDGDLGELACGDEARVKGGNDWVVFDGRKGAHVEDSPHLGPAAPDASTATIGAAIAIERGKTDEGTDLFAGQTADLRGLGKQSARYYLADARNGA